MKPKKNWYKKSILLLNEHNNHDDTSIPKNTLYHYTDLNGLQGILSTRKLWLKDYQHLKDKKEVIYSMEAIQEQLSLHLQKTTFQDFWTFFEKKYPKQIDHTKVFTFSFCEKRDLLDAWVGYGDKGNGYAIGFRKNFFRTNNLNRLGLKFVAMLYDKSKFQRYIQKKLVLTEKELLQNHWQDSRQKGLDVGTLLSSILFSYLPILKTPDYDIEFEYRVFENFFTYEERSWPKPPPSRHPENNILKSNTFEHDEICEVWIGPCCDFSYEVKKIKSMLSLNGYDTKKIKIIRSNLDPSSFHSSG